MVEFISVRLDKINLAIIIATAAAVAASSASSALARATAAAVKTAASSSPTSTSLVSYTVHSIHTQINVNLLLMSTYCVTIKSTLHRHVSCTI